MRHHVFTASLLCALMATVAQGSIEDFRQLSIDFTRQDDAAAKATWSNPKVITISAEGIGWEGKPSESREGWIQTQPLAVGLSWRPATSASIRVTLDPALKVVQLDNGQTFTPYGGNLFVRHSPDLEHWSSWQALSADRTNPDASRVFTGVVAVPQRDQKDYHAKAEAYAKLDVPWPSDEEALVKWIVAKDPDYFSRTRPFVGYVEFLFETSFPGGQRITALKATASSGISGLQTIPKDPKAAEGRDQIPWRFRSPTLEPAAIPESTWDPLMEKLQKGRTENEVMEILRPYQVTPGPATAGGGAHMRIHRLDREWILRCDYEDHGNTLFSRKLIREPLRPPTAPVSKDLLPMTVRIEGMRDPAHPLLMEASMTEIQLKKQKEQKWIVVATIPMDLAGLAAATAQTRVGDFRGNHDFLSKEQRDGAIVTMKTPLGEITEYGVFFTKEIQEWPDEILRLEPLYTLFGKWSVELEKAEEKSGK